MKGYATISRPLIDLLKKDGFGWNLGQHSPSKHLKLALILAPMLALPNFECHFEV